MKTKHILSILALLILSAWSIYTHYDIEQWNQDKQRHRIMIHQFDKAPVPQIQDNPKCQEDYTIQLQYDGDKAIIRCGSLYWPFYDEIVVDKDLVEKAYATSLNEVLKE